MKKRIPTFQFVVDDTEETGVKAISIVDDPAFQSSFVLFEKQKPVFVELADAKGKKKQICAGLSLIPNVPVYRVDPVFGEYYGYFSPETIEKIVDKFHEEMNYKRVNLNHDKDKFIDAYMVEDFIVNTDARVQDLKEKGIEHENIKGAWFTAFRIKDEKVFNDIVNGSSKMGFSVESMLDRVIVSMNKTIMNNNLEKMKKDKKSLLDKIIQLFTKEDLNRVLVDELGFEIQWTDPGMPVQQIKVDEEGKETFTPLEKGEYKTDMGVVLS